MRAWQRQEEVSWVGSDMHPHGERGIQALIAPDGAWVTLPQGLALSLSLSRHEGMPISGYARLRSLWGIVVHERSWVEVGIVVSPGTGQGTRDGYSGTSLPVDCDGCVCVCVYARALLRTSFVTNQVTYARRHAPGRSRRESPRAPLSPRRRAKGRDSSSNIQTLGPSNAAKGCCLSSTALGLLGEQGG